MLQTPLGMIELKKDGKKIDCTVKKIENDDRCPELNGRFAMLVDYIPDGQAHTISCCIKRYRTSKDDYVESDKNAEIKSFRKGSTKLSIGMFSGVPEGWKNSPDRAANDETVYLKNGVQYHIKSNAKRVIYLFGIAWLENFNEENEAQTWYGADPTIWWDEMRNEEEFLFGCIKREIDKWDPYGFFPDAPSDEYDGESRKIARIITVDSSANGIAEIVADVFSDSFGPDGRFTADFCRAVAGRIEHRISKDKSGKWTDKL